MEPAKKPGNKQVVKSSAVPKGEIILPPKRRPVHDRTADEKPPYSKAWKRGERTGQGKTGRAPSEISEETKDMIRKLAAIGCPVREISHVTNIPVSTLNQKWLGLINEGRMGRNVSLRKKQHDIAMKGDRTMLIWLGKTQLGQSDRIQVVEDPDATPAATMFVVEFVEPKPLQTEESKKDDA